MNVYLFIYLEEQVKGTWTLVTQEEVLLHNSLDLNYVLFDLCKNEPDIPADANAAVKKSFREMFIDIHRIKHNKIYRHAYIHDLQILATELLLEQSTSSKKYIKHINTILAIFPELQKGKRRIIYYSSHVG